MQLDACEQLSKIIEKNNVDCIIFGNNIYDSNSKKFINNEVNLEENFKNCCNQIISNKIIIKNSFDIPLNWWNKLYNKNFIIKNNLKLDSNLKYILCYVLFTCQIYTLANTIYITPIFIHTEEDQV